MRLTADCPWAVELRDPVRLADGALGTAMRIESELDPVRLFSAETIGVQVPGEEEMRWVSRDDLERVGDGAWQERVG